MAFIPIDAKADITGSKKGKLTPAQHAQLNAWCLAEKTGILDCLGRCESKDGVLTYTVSEGKATIVLQKGFLVICGRLVECEEDTMIEVPAPVSGTVNGKICAEFSLGANGEEEFKIITKVGGMLTQEDLNENPLSGVYEFELYSYTATPYLVTLKTRTIPYVPDIGGKLSQFEASLKDEGKPLHGYDDTKGTIEERLTKLGFNAGSVSGLAGATLDRYGKFAILYLPRTHFSERKDYTLTLSFTSAIDINIPVVIATGQSTSPFYKKIAEFRGNTVVLKDMLRNCYLEETQIGFIIQ